MRSEKLFISGNVVGKTFGLKVLFSTVVLRRRMGL